MKDKLIKSIHRSEYSYKLYLSDKLYYQAKRIYKANLELYKNLTDYLYSPICNCEDEVVIFLFHLEDWFEQFDATVKQSSPQLEDGFVFNRLVNSIPYPKEFKNNL